MSEAVWIDLSSRRMVGWNIDQQMDAALVIEALKWEQGHRQEQQEQLLVHTDQGCEYRATDHRNQLRKHGIVLSMSAKGCC